MLTIRGEIVTGYGLHADPVWRDRANFIIDAPIVDSSGIEFEQLWVRRDSSTELYEVCCIPFFVYNLSLGDRVTVTTTEGGAHHLGEVVERSGRFTFRVFFGEVDLSVQAGVLEDLSKAPLLIERYSPDLIAIDIDGEKSAWRLADYLAESQKNGRLIYEGSRNSD